MTLKNMCFLVPEKTVTLFLFSLFVFLQNGFSQVPTIQYDFKKNQVDSVLPFDQRFNLKFKNLDIDLDSVFITFTEVPNTKKALKLKKKQVNKVTDPGIQFAFSKSDSNKNVVLNSTNINSGKLTNSSAQDTLSVKDIFKYSNSSVLEIRAPFDTAIGYTAIPFQLRYNRDYIISIGGEENRPLSVSEKAALREFLLKKLSETDWLDKTIKQSENFRSGREINPWLLKFYSEARSLIKSQNPLYNFAPVSVELEIERFKKNQDIVVGFIKYYRNLSRIPDSIFSHIHWNSLIKNDLGYTNLLNSLKPLKYDIDKLNSIISDLDSALDYRDRTIQSVQDLVDELIINRTTVRGIITPTYHNSLTRNASYYFTVDLGYIYNYYVDDFYPTVTLTVYPRPVNPNLPFGHYSGMDKLWTRIGILAGTTLISIEEDGKRKGIIGNKGLLLGVGYRLLPFAKINGGFLVLKADDPNPLVTKYETKLSWFIGVSLDLNVANLIKSTFINNY